MAISPEDELREIYELRRRLGELRVRAAKYGAEVPIQITTEIADLELRLAGTDTETTGALMQQAPSGGVTRYEFNQLATQVNRITLVLVLATVALVLSLAAFIMALIILVSFR